jgi:exportin-T
MDDKLNLFETVGILIGRSKLEPEQQRQHLQSLITPHIRHIEQLVAAAQLSNPMYAPEEMFVQQASNAIAVIAFLTKGFRHPPAPVQALLAEILPYSLQVLGTMPQSELVRGKTMILQQRMILCTGKATLPSGRHFLRLLIDHCTSEDILLVAQLINQYAKFRTDAEIVLESELVPFLLKCNSLAQSEARAAGADGSTVSLSHEAVEEQRVRKLAYTVLQTIVAYDATIILVSEANIVHLPFFLETMCNGALLVTDVSTQKTCLKFFKDLTSQLTTPQNGSVIGGDVALTVLAYVCQVLVPKTIQMFVGFRSKLQDAATAKLITEVSVIISTLRSHERLQQLLEQGTAETKLLTSVSILASVLSCENSSTNISKQLLAQLNQEQSWNRH